MTDPSTIIAGMSARQKKALWEAKRSPWHNGLEVSRRHWACDMADGLVTLGLCDGWGRLIPLGLAVLATGERG